MVPELDLKGPNQGRYHHCIALVRQGKGGKREWQTSSTRLPRLLPLGHRYNGEQVELSISSFIFKKMLTHHSDYFDSNSG